MRLLEITIVTWLSFCALYIITEVRAQGVNCNVPGDVIFLMDASDSIDPMDWEREKNFVEILIDSLTIQPNAIHVGMVVYSTFIGDVIGLKPYKTKSRLKTIARNLTQLRDGTDTALGIAEVRKMFRLQGRSNTPHVAIVITDGLSTIPAETVRQAFMAKREGTAMIAVGIGDQVFMDELRDIASSASTLFNVQDFRALQGLVQSLRDIICWEIKTTTTTTTTTTTPRPRPTPPTLPPWTPILPNVLACSSPADVIFVMDGSDSIIPMDWIREKQFVAQLINSFDIGPSAINVGAVVYSSIVGDVIQLRPFKSKQKIVNMIMSLKQPRFSTNTKLGIAMARQMVAYQGRKDTPQIIIVITDGKSDRPTDSIIQAMGAKSEGITMIAVGVGIDIFMDELRGIASTQKNLFLAADFRALQGLVATLKDLICKVITTTPAPIPTTTPTPQITTTDGLCDGPVMDKGVGYNSYPGDCTKYVQCYQQGNTFRSVIRPCPFGTFWDQNAVTCSSALNVLCRYDICRTMPDYVIYEHSGPGCRPYWMCMGQRSLPQCCPSGSRFIDKVGCIVDSSCMETCMSHHHENHTEAGCMLKTHSDKRFYLEKIAGFGEIARPCAPGSIFSEKQCTCITAPDQSLHSQVCKSSVQYSFDHGIDDKSHNGVTAGVNNVRISNRGTAMFNGKSQVNLWRFAGVEFGPELVLKFRYRMWTPATDWTPGSGGTWSWDASSNSWINSTSSAGSWMSGMDGVWVGTNDQTGQQWLGVGDPGGHWVGTVGTGTGSQTTGSGLGYNFWSGLSTGGMWPGMWQAGTGMNGVGLGSMWTGAFGGNGISGSSSSSGSGNWIGSSSSSTGSWSGTFGSGNGGTWSGVARTGSGTWSGTTTNGQLVTGTWSDMSGAGTYGIWNVTSGPWLGTSGVWSTNSNGGGSWVVTQVAGMSNSGGSSWSNTGRFDSSWNMNTQGNTGNTGSEMWTGILDLGGNNIDGVWKGALDTGTSWSRGSETGTRSTSTWNNVQGSGTNIQGGSTSTSTGNTGLWTDGTGETVNTDVDQSGINTQGATTGGNTNNVDDSLNQITGNLDITKVGAIDGGTKGTNTAQTGGTNQINRMYSLDTVNFLGGKWDNGNWVSDSSDTGPQTSVDTSWTFEKEISGGQTGPTKPVVNQPRRNRWQIVGNGKPNIPVVDTPTTGGSIESIFNVDGQWVVQPNKNQGQPAVRVEGGRWVKTPTNPSSTTTDSQGRSFITGSGMWKIVGPDGRIIRSGVGNSIPANVINELMGNTGSVGWTKQLEWTIIGPNGQLLRSGTGQIPQNLRNTGTVLAGGFFDVNLGDVSQWVIISADGQITKHGIGSTPNVPIPQGSLLMKIIWSSGNQKWTVSKPDGSVIKSGAGNFPQKLDLSNLLNQVKSTGRFGIGQTGSTVVTGSAGGGRWIVGGNQALGGQPSVVRVGSGPLPMNVGGSSQWTVSGSGSGAGVPGRIDINKIMGGNQGQSNPGGSSQWTVSGSSTGAGVPGGIDINKIMGGNQGQSNPGGSSQWTVSRTGTGGPSNIDINKIIGAMGGKIPGSSVGSSGPRQGFSGTATFVSNLGTSGQQGGSDTSNILGVSSIAGSGRVDSTPLGSRGAADLERGSFDVKVDKTNIGPVDYSLRRIQTRSKRSLSRPQAIISNCNGINGEGPSIMVSGGPDYVTFSVKTSHNVRPAQLTIPARPGYNDVTMIYDGQNLKAKVNDIARSIPLTGKIEMRQAGLLFGACNGFDHFRGEIDDFEMYECIPPYWG